MRRPAPLLLSLTLVATASADPLLTSWFTEKSGQYARIYRTTADEAAGTSATTWSRGQANQSLPTYAGIHEISFTITDVYIRNTYTESFHGAHSPILGWVRDGYPVYGPYGNADALDPTSGVRRMITGYQKRDGSNGSTDLNGTGRTSLPAWVGIQGRSTTISTTQHGPAVSDTYILGHYLEDYAYKGDLGFTQGRDFDLDQHNGRFCVTPDYPNGTYAYFVSIEANGVPAFPYNIGATYYGNPTGSTAGAIPANGVILKPNLVESDRRSVRRRLSAPTGRCVTGATKNGFPFSPSWP